MGRFEAEKGNRCDNLIKESTAAHVFEPLRVKDDEDSDNSKREVDDLK
jgi:hypothetical protein